MDLSVKQSSPPPIWDLVEESFSEAAFLWGLWEAGLDSHVRDVAGLRFWVEERLLGALDGLLVAGDAALETLLIPALGGDEPFETTAAAHAIATQATPAGTDALVAAVRKAEPAKLPLFRRALELCGSDVALARLEPALAKDAGPSLQALLLDVRTFRRLPPGAAGERALAAGESSLTTARLRALRHGPPEAAERAVESHLGSSDAAARDAALETGLIAGSTAAWTRCRELATAAAPELTFERGLQGGELAEVQGASRAGGLRFELPRAWPRISVRLAGSTETPPQRLETVMIEPEQNRVSLSWRSEVPCDKRALKIERVTIQI